VGNPPRYTRGIDTKCINVVRGEGRNSSSLTKRFYKNSFDQTGRVDIKSCGDRKSAFEEFEGKYLMVTREFERNSSGVHGRSFH
jgi:hypothetical protein